MTNFKYRWNIKSNWQMFVIIIVFAVTGSTAAYLSKPILRFFDITKESTSVWIYYTFYIALIFPIYQVLLVGLGFLVSKKNPD